MQLILASASPRRAALLRDAGYSFAVEPARLDEEALSAGVPPRQLAVFLANIKADEVAGRFPSGVTLAADTVVLLGAMSVGKPGDERQAGDLLRRLRGTTHEVITGVAVRFPDGQLALSGCATSTVRMRGLSDIEIDRYIASGRWRGKAGGYGIQDADPIVTCVAGSVSNVVGLPMEETAELLARAGIKAGSAG